MDPAPTVLVVDDETAICEALRRALARRGLRALEAYSAEQALDVLARERVDLIISDHKMPGMTGLQFLARAREIAPEVPRVLMTAYPETDLAIEGTNVARIARFLTKPFKLDEAMRLVQELLDKALEERARAAALERARSLAEELSG